MATNRTSDFFSGFLEEIEKISGRKEEKVSKEKEGGRFRTAKILSLIGAGAGTVPGAAFHLQKLKAARRDWAKITPKKSGMEPSVLRTQKWQRTRFNPPDFIRRSLIGSAAGFASGALTGALIDLIRKRRKANK